MPGEETQWDWLELPDPPASWGWSKACVLVGSRSHAGRWRAVLTPAMDQAQLIDGLDRVTRALGGVTKRWRFDRMATVCHPDSGMVTASLAGVAKHYAVLIKICPPRSGASKRGGGEDQPRRGATLVADLGEVRQYSDIHGRHYVRMDNSVSQRQALARRLESAGCLVDLSGSDWHSTGDLTPPAPPGGGLPMGRKMPSSEAVGRPQFKATLQERGGNRLSPLKLTNLGPGTAHNVDVRTVNDDERMLTRDTDDLPIPRLPRGSTVKVMSLMPLRLSDRNRSYFEIVVTATIDDGTTFEDILFVSGE